jgi:hypothetical protein
MKKEEVIGILEKLQNDFQEKETKCFEDMAFMRKHNFEMEANAIKYKQEAYNDAWLAIFNEIDKLQRDE